jgi:hypothetical protein
MNSQDEIIRSLLAGAVEFHFHPGPDGTTPRKVDAFEALREAKSAGMRAMVLKDKSCGTGAIAQLANKYADGVTAVGAITLDTSIGGLNPEAVEIEATLGSKVVWMPTYSAQNDPTKKKTDKGVRRYNLTILDDNGELLPGVNEIIEIVKERDMVLATGHISKKESFALIKAAASRGLKKMVVTHPLNINVRTRMTVEEQKTLSQMGAYMEHTWVATMPKHDHLPHNDCTQAIRAVGVAKCIAATDFGQVHNPAPLEGFRLMLAGLLKEGFSAGEVAVMVKDNPAKLLEL